MTTRGVLIGLGVVVGAYGAYLLLSLGLANLLATAIWLVVGVIVHDAVIGPALVVLGALLLLVVPQRVRGPVFAGLVVLGTVTITAIPVLGRFGARPDNPTLLPRNYTVGWLVFAGLVVVATGLAVVRSLRAHPVPVDDVEREPHDEIPEGD